MRYDYDALGRQTAVTNPMGQTTCYEYDTYSQLTAIVDPKGNPVHDKYGQQTRKTWADGTFEAFDYSVAGNLMTHRWSNSNLADLSDDTVQAFHYDSMNRIAQAVYTTPSQPDTVYNYNYDSRGSLDTIRDANSALLMDYTYDALGRPSEVTNPFNQSVGYTYDANGNRTSLITPAGTTTYTYDALDRLESVVDPQSGAAKPTLFTYDARPARYPHSAQRHCQQIRL